MRLLLPGMEHTTAYNMFVSAFAIMSSTAIKYPSCSRCRMNCIECPYMDNHKVNKMEMLQVSG